MARKKYKPKPKKLMSEGKRRKLIKWIESRIRQGLPKDKGRAKGPATTKSHGRLIYTWKNGIINNGGKKK
jgi:hypothetical protein